MAAGDVKTQYAASVALSVTILNNGSSITSSTSHLLGWESAVIDNSTNKYTDYRITAKIQVESTGLTAGEIRMHIITELDDTTWPDVFDGTESVETVTDTEIRNAICHYLTGTDTDTTASRVYYLSVPSLKRALGNVPRKFVLFITQSTGNVPESTGSPNQVYVQGQYENVAAA